jgi:hypothetical protein
MMSIAVLLTVGGQHNTLALQVQASKVGQLRDPTERLRILANGSRALADTSHAPQQQRAVSTGPGNCAVDAQR